MPCLFALLAYFAPRLALVLLVVFSDYLGTAYQNHLVPFLGFLFLPLTTLGYAWAIHSQGSVQGLGLVVVVLALLLRRAHGASVLRARVQPLEPLARGGGDGLRAGGRELDQARHRLARFPGRECAGGLATLIRTSVLFILLFFLVVGRVSDKALRVLPPNIAQRALPFQIDKEERPPVGRLAGHRTSGIGGARERATFGFQAAIT